MLPALLQEVELLGKDLTRHKELLGTSVLPGSILEASNSDPTSRRHGPRRSSRSDDIRSMLMQIASEGTLPTTVYAANSSQNEYVDSDPWEGFEDLAREDLLEWSKDFLRAQANALALEGGALLQDQSMSLRGKLDCDESVQPGRLQRCSSATMSTMTDVSCSRLSASSCISSRSLTDCEDWESLNQAAQPLMPSLPPGDLCYRGLPASVAAAASQVRRSKSACAALEPNRGQSVMRHAFTRSLKPSGQWATLDAVPCGATCGTSHQSAEMVVDGEGGARRSILRSSLVPVGSDFIGDDSHTSLMVCRSLIVQGAVMSLT